MSDLRLFVGNREPSLSYTITSDGSAVDISGADVDSVTFSMRLSTSATLKVNASSATIVDDGSTALRGKVAYSWATNDVDTAGDYLGWFTVNYTSGKTQDTPEFPIEFVDHAPYARELCSVGDVREFLGSVTVDRTRDGLIEDLVVRVGETITRFTGREFRVDSSSSPRLFEIGARSLAEGHIAIDDLSAVPTANVEIRDADDVTLATIAPGSFEWVPLRRPYSWQPITGLRPRPASGASFAYGSRLMVDGIWGFPEVPDDVRHAAILTVASWVQREVEGVAFISDDARQTSPAASGPSRGLGIPAAARARLTAYREPVIA